MEDMEENALKIYTTMFNDKENVTINDKKYWFDRTPQLGLRILKIGEYKFLEQNPEKDSHWGVKAREGQKTLGSKKSDYITQVYEGVFRYWG
jgi:hypothetical protein